MEEYVYYLDRSLEDLKYFDLEWNECIEKWKDIPWFEKLYQISDCWRVKSLWRNKNNGNWSFYKDVSILKPSICEKWYVKIVITKNNKLYNFFVHKLVLNNFLENPLNKDQTNHKDWNKKRNIYWNLEPNTNSENQKHRHRELWHTSHFKWKFWILSASAKPVNQYDLDWNFIRSWDSISDAGRWLWINVWHVPSCCKWKKKQSLGFIWKYKN